MKLYSSITFLLLLSSITSICQIGGSGGAGYIPKFTAGAVIGNSSIHENATGVGIGTTNAAYKLDVNGNIRATSSANMDISAFGSGSTVYIRSSYYNRTNNFGALPTVNDIANGASLGYVDNFTAGWTGYANVNRSTGFVPGTYDVFVRIRTNGAGNAPTACTFGIYDGTALTYPIITTLTSLSTSYQEVYGGRYVLTAAMLANNLITFFSSAGVTTNYYLDYVKLVPAPIFNGGNVMIGTTIDNGYKMDVIGTCRSTGFSLTGTQQTPNYISANGGGDNSKLFIQAGSTAGVYSQIEVTGNWDGAANVGGKIAMSTGGIERFRIFSNGIVGVGVPTTVNLTDVSYKLYVETGIRTRKIKVDAPAIAWADYVFDDGYKMLTLPQLDKFIQRNKHLPDMPTTAEVKENGIDLGDTQAKLLQKIEELTLYIIAQDKKIASHDEKEVVQNALINKLVKEMEALKSNQAIIDRYL